MNATLNQPSFGNLIVKLINDGSLQGTQAPFIEELDQCSFFDKRMTHQEFADSSVGSVSTCCQPFRGFAKFIVQAILDKVILAKLPGKHCDHLAIRGRDFQAGFDKDRISKAKFIGLKYFYAPLCTIERTS